MVSLREPEDGCVRHCSDPSFIPLALPFIHVLALAQLSSCALGPEFMFCFMFHASCFLLVARCSLLRCRRRSRALERSEFTNKPFIYLPYRRPKPRIPMGHRIDDERFDRIQCSLISDSCPCPCPCPRHQTDAMNAGKRQAGHIRNRGCRARLPQPRFATVLCAMQGPYEILYNDQLCQRHREDGKVEGTSCGPPHKRNP